VNINQAALDKVRAAKMNGGSFAMVLESIGAMLALTGAAETSMSFDYQHDDIEVEAGDLIPVITISLRQATVKQLTADEAPEKADEAEATVEAEDDLPG
jgi:hypothetical protein